MAGMFYSLQESAEKLNKTEEELKQMVKDGLLREFRDGANLLFKVEEVEALMSDTSAMEIEEIPAAETPEPQAPTLEELSSDAQEPEASEPEIPEPELYESEVPEPEAPEIEIPEPEVLEPEITAEVPEPEIMAEDTSVPEAPVPLEEAAGSSEILLAPETVAPGIPSDLTDADTALTGQGTSVLGETDQDYEITDDTMAETSIPGGGLTGTTPEVPLEEIEEDVNLDSFGSGSGLLDLSLQADDTSLGGILDEIYTAEGEGKEPVGAESGSAAAVTAEPEETVPEEELAAPLPAPEMPALAQPYIEMAPDTQSNTLGMLLFLPLAIVIYTSAVVMAGLKGIMPSILGAIQGLIWYIMGAAAVVSGLVVGAAFMLTGEKSTKTKKPKKPKKEKVKKEKVKKEKKPKKEKKAKKAK